MAEQDLNAIAFPTFDEAQMARIEKYASGTPKKFQAGQALFHVGDRDVEFFVIKSGEVEIVDESGDQPKTMMTVGAGQFTGDVGHLTGNPKVVSGIAKTDCEVYQISVETLRGLLNQDPRLSDLILQAFIARRQENRVLFTWLDLEGDPALSQVIEQFGVSEAETPIVACASRVLLRNPSNLELAEAIG